MNIMEQPVKDNTLLQTDRILLRPWRESDAETLYEEEMLEYVTLHNIDIEYYLTQY